MNISAINDIGWVKEQNEDYVWIPGAQVFGNQKQALDVQIPENHPLIIGLVADGCGGKPAGMEAATTVGRAIQNGIEAIRAPDAETFRKAVHEICTRTQQQLLEVPAKDPAKTGMGTCMTALATQGGQIHLIHAGDSRCYRMQDGQLAQKSQDHTAPRRGRRPRLANCFGKNGSNFYAQVETLDTKPGDGLLLCTDGLTDMIPDRDLEAILAQALPGRQKAGQLLDTAMKQGGKDNVSAIWIETP